MSLPLPFIGKIIDKIWPDKEEAEKAKVRLFEADQAGELAELDAELKISLAQISVNAEDAKSNSRFQSWWRPAAGWICIFGLFYPVFTSLLTWLLQLIAWLFAVDITQFPIPPKIDTDYLITLLTGLLGLGGMRSWEKNKKHSEWSK
ncbi:MAG: holin family protein [Spirochaetia bacterium]|nr:holin family protein [Spirochaetia bacterium]